MKPSRIIFVTRNIMTETDKKRFGFKIFRKRGMEIRSVHMSMGKARVKEILRQNSAASFAVVLVLLDFSSYYIYRTLTKCKIPYAVDRMLHMPAFPHSKSRGMVNKIQGCLGIRRPDMILCSGRKSLQEGDDHSKAVYIHALDYDQYLETK